jgi:hypothetical protein
MKALQFITAIPWNVRRRPFLEADSGNEWRVCVGPKLLHRVLFGLATLESAVTALAQAGTGAADVASKASFLSE